MLACLHSLWAGFVLSSLFVLLWGKESGFIALDDLKVSAMLLPWPSRDAKMTVRTTMPEYDAFSGGLATLALWWLTGGMPVIYRRLQKFFWGLPGAQKFYHI